MIPYTLDKIRRLKSQLTVRGLAIPVEVDGGVNAGTLAEVVATGADILVMGASIFAGEGSIASSLNDICRQLAELIQ
jgi:ribulose-phosphate 3-epimerase